MLLPCDLSGRSEPYPATYVTFVTAPLLLARDDTDGWLSALDTLVHCGQLRSDGIRGVLPPADLPRLYRFLSFWALVRHPPTPRLTRLLRELDETTPVARGSLVPTARSPRPTMDQQPSGSSGDHRRMRRHLPAHIQPSRPVHPTPDNHPRLLPPPRPPRVGRLSYIRRHRQPSRPIHHVIPQPSISASPDAPRIPSLVHYRSPPASTPTASSSPTPRSPARQRHTSLDELTRIPRAHLLAYLSAFTRTL
jgi:hypothetical protein